MDNDLYDILSEPIHELKERLFGLYPDIPDEMMGALSADPRKAARRLAERIRRFRIRDMEEQKRLENLHLIENQLYDCGYALIAGIDEAGVAPLAGPVVAAAVILPRNYMLAGLDDSKKISKIEKREMLADRIKKDAIAWATGSAEVEEIDSLNVFRSGLLAMARSLEGLKTKPEFVLVDARTIPHCAIPQKAIVHGDALCASIAAASLIAKTTRDRCMLEMDRVYPEYGFAAHKGYPTPAHLKALKRFGPVPIHRTSFAPVKEALETEPVQKSLFQAFEQSPCSDAHGSSKH